MWHQKLAESIRAGLPAGWKLILYSLACVIAAGVMSASAFPELSESMQTKVVVFVVLSTALVGTLLSLYVHQALLNPVNLLRSRVKGVSSGANARADVARMPSTPARELQLLADDLGRMLERLRIERERKQRTQEVLRQREARLHAVFNGAADGILTADDKWRIESANWAAVKLFGYVRDELIGQHIHKLFAPPVGDEAAARLSSGNRLHRAQVVGVRSEVKGLKKDGSTFPMYLTTNLVEHAGESRYVLIVRDITDLRHMHEQVLRAQHLASLGEMGASVAHEIRNPVAGISSAIQVLREEFSRDLRLSEIIGEMLQNISRVDKTVRHLLMFAKKWEVKRESCDLVQTITAAWKRAKQEDDCSNVTLSVSEGEDIRIPADPILLQQVLFNLFMNAAQAMDNRGAIECTIAEGESHWLIFVRDHGPGMTPDEMEAAFRPFYTKKVMGTGLGLGICKHIMEAHGGGIRLRTSDGPGLLVELTLPVSETADATGSNEMLMPTTA